ncbi:segregation/condensation protein A [Xanthobacter dioxanivorans]|uniref:Segregation and condensation protein A n=1 Tax=Xanthobacter dioxanivorans TaxID=2528964 RepID=A0A974PKA3_9HYPH|nr:ScpA family protein [Xanthobacter dioxanivorans]QRG05145.1 segregation/condensation protein A [Xanthobacter dioxanivorans]
MAGEAAPDAFEIGADSAPAGSGEAFVVDVDGFEGPLDLLLALARTQKVDLTRISILALADQYLAFIEEARRGRLELAADYLVMAAWLAYLKSRLLLPAPPQEEGPSAEELAAAFTRRLRHLERIRKAAEELMGRPQLGRETFARVVPDPEAVPRYTVYTATLYDLLTAYARQRQTQVLSHVTLKTRAVWSLAEARARLERLLGAEAVGAWMRLDQFLLDYMTEPGQRATVLASSFSASLEMVREGTLDIRQDAPFAPLWLRPRPAEPPLPGIGPGEPGEET